MLSSLLKLLGLSKPGVYAQVLPDGGNDEGVKEEDATLWALEKKKPQVAEDVAEELFVFTLELKIHHLHTAPGPPAQSPVGGKLVWYTHSATVGGARGMVLTSLFLDTLPTQQPNISSSSPAYDPQLLPSPGSISLKLKRVTLNAKILGLLGQLANLISSYFPRISTSAFSSNSSPPKSNFVLSLDYSLALLSLSFSALEFGLPIIDSACVTLLLPVVELLLGALQAIGLSVPYDATIDTRVHYAATVQIAISLISVASRQSPTNVVSCHEASILIQNLSPSLSLIAHHGNPDIYHMTCRRHWRVCCLTLVGLDAYSGSGALATYSRIRSVLALSSPAPRDLSSEVAACMNLGAITARMRFLLQGVKMVLAAGLVAAPQSSSRHGQNLAVISKLEWLTSLQESLQLMLGTGQGGLSGSAVLLAPTLLEMLLHFFINQRSFSEETEAGLGATTRAMSSLLVMFTQQLQKQRGRGDKGSPFRPLSSNPAIDRFMSTHGVGLVRVGSGRSIASDSAPETYSTIGSAAFALTDSLGERLSGRLGDSTSSIGQDWGGSPSRPGGSSSGTPARPPVFAPGDKVDGLCVTHNGSKRWFPAICTALNAEAQTCNLKYSDGDVAVDKPLTEVRPMKRRGPGRGGSSAAGSPTVLTPPVASSATTSSMPTLNLATTESALDTMTSTSAASLIEPVTPNLKQSGSPIDRETPANNFSSLYISPPSGKPLADVGIKHVDASDSDNDSEDNVFEIPSVLAVDGSTGLGSTPASSFTNNNGGLNNSTKQRAQNIVSRLQLHDLPLDQSGSGIFGAGSLSGGIIMDTSADTELMHGYGLSLHSSRLHSASSLSRPPTGAISGRYTDRRPLASRGGGGDVLMSASEQKPLRGSARSGTPLTASMSDSTARMLTWRDGSEPMQGGYPITGRSTSRLTSKQGIRPHSTGQVAPLSATNPYRGDAINSATIEIYTLVAAVCIIYASSAVETAPESVASAALLAVEEFLTEASLFGALADNVTNSLYLLASTLVGPNGRRLVTLLGVPPMPSVPKLVKLAESGVRLGHGMFGSVTRVDVSDLDGALEWQNGQMQPPAKSYAIKRVSRFKSGGASTAFEATLNEIAVWEQLMQERVPGVVSLLSYGVVRDEYWLVMTLGGDSLGSWRAQLTPSLMPRKQQPQALPVAAKYWLAFLLELYCEACLVVKGLHEAGVVHFDVKADNFLFARSFAHHVEQASAAAAAGQAEEFTAPISALLGHLRRCHREGRHAGVLLLTDFGESVVLPFSGESTRRQFKLTSCKGTLPIQAPEMIALNSSNKDDPGIAKRFTSPSKPADVWSLGCLCVEVLTGRMLFENMSWAELFVVLCTSEGMNPSPSRRPISLAALLQNMWAHPVLAGDVAELENLKRLVSRELNVDAANRPTAAQVCLEMEQVLTEVLATDGVQGDGEVATREAEAMDAGALDPSSLPSQSYPDAAQSIRTQDCVALPAGAILDFRRSQPSAAPLCSIILQAPLRYRPSPVSDILRADEDEEQAGDSVLGSFEEPSLSSGLSHVLSSLSSRCISAGGFADKQIFVQLVPDESPGHLVESGTVSWWDSSNLPSSTRRFTLQVPVVVSGEVHEDVHAEHEAVRSLATSLAALQSSLDNVRAASPDAGLTVFIAPLDRQQRPPPSLPEAATVQVADGSFFSLVGVYTAILLHLWWSDVNGNDTDGLRAIQWIGLLPEGGSDQVWRLKRRLEGYLKQPA